MPSAADAMRTYSIDEIAVATGLPSRTIRHYQSEKVLPPPQRRGRTAVYGDEHLQRLKLIAKLQQRGLSLRAIRDALDEVERGGLSLEDWLGLSDELRRPWADDGAAVVPVSQLQQRLEEHPRVDLATLIEVGLARPPEGEPPACVVPSPALLDMALALDAAGVDVPVSAGAVQRLQASLRGAADELVDYFVEHAGEGFAASLRPEDLTPALDALRRLSADAVRLLYAQQVERALRQRFSGLGLAPDRSALDQDVSR
jgi:DNA-binding transcriptional MerR regulator